MKAKVIRGSGFRGALNYVFDAPGAQRGGGTGRAKEPEIVGGTMSGATPRALAAEFAATRRVRPDIERPVWHCSLSLPPGEHLSTEKWGAVAADFMERMGFGDQTPWVAVRHQDTDKDHIHVIASRVGLDGKVWLGQWEARKAIEATQFLEREHGLTLTPGLGEARAERRALTDKEINMAIRTGEEPPRQRLQRLLDEAVQDGPTVVEFAERLEAAGVIVRANLASTGRMNGFSFEVAGVPFKGSDLGKGYTWAGIQKAGVTYDEARDRAGLERFRPAVADRGERQDVAAVREPDARAHGATAGRSFDRDRPGSEAAGAFVQAGDGRLGGPGPTAPGSGRGAGEHDGTDGEPRRGDGSVRQGGKLGGAADGRHAEQDHPSRGGPDRGLGEGGGGSRDDALAPAPVAAGTGDRGRGASRGSNRGADWASRFKRSSARRRAAGDRADEGGGSVAGQSLGQSHTTGTRIAPADRRAARELDPTAYLEASGYTVKREGRHLSVRYRGDEVYRVTRHDGRWLWCDRYGNEGGDNIDLVQEIEGPIGYGEAVYRLLGAPIVPALTPPPPPRVPPRPPRQTAEDLAAGRDYLMAARGISLATIEHAEKSGMVRYARGGVLFVGYDRTGVPQNVTRRAIDPAELAQKRDLRGSDKSYPPILPGDPSTVWIVEGGTDALALFDIARRNGRQSPSVIVSGGAHVLSFLGRAEVQAMLQAARHVVIAADRDSPQVQMRTGPAHQEQARRVAEIVGQGKVTIWTPPEGTKDIADLNLALVEREQTRSRSDMGMER